MAQEISQYPLVPNAWEFGRSRNCLLELARQYEVPYIAVPSFDCPHLLQYIQRLNLSVIVATDGPIMRGSMLYVAKYGILSVHAAHLPVFRGNWATYFNLYHNQPLKVSAFIMQPWIDEGILLGTKDVTIVRGMSLPQIDGKRYEWPTGISVDICRVPRPVGFRTSALSAAA